MKANSKTNWMKLKLIPLAAANNPTNVIRQSAIIFISFRIQQLKPELRIKFKLLADSLTKLIMLSAFHSSRRISAQINCIKFAYLFNLLLLIHSCSFQISWTFILSSFLLFHSIAVNFIIRILFICRFRLLINLSFRIVLLSVWNGMS